MYDVKIEIDDFDYFTGFCISYEMPDDRTYSYYFYASNKDELKAKIKYVLENDIPLEGINLCLYRCVNFYFDEISRSVRNVVFLP